MEYIEFMESANRIKIFYDIDVTQTDYNRAELMPEFASQIENGGNCAVKKEDDQEEDEELDILDFLGLDDERDIA